MKLISFSCKKFNCERCHFHCNNRNDWNRHIRTYKHNKLTVSKVHQCVNCEKTYKYMSGLSRHKKTCSMRPVETLTVTQTMLQQQMNIVQLLMQTIKTAAK